MEWQPIETAPEHIRLWRPRIQVGDSLFQAWVGWDAEAETSELALVRFSQPYESTGEITPEKWLRVPYPPE